MTTVDLAPSTADAAALGAARLEAVRGLEGAFSELMSQFQRMFAQAAELTSPGMLPGTFKVLATIARIGPITLSALAERLVSDKGMLSRHVSDLEGLGLVERTPDPADRRARRIVITTTGMQRLDAAREPYDGRFVEVLESWPVDSIERLTGLLHALAVGERPAL